MKNIVPVWAAKRKGIIFFPKSATEYDNYILTLPEQIEVIVRKPQKHSFRSNQQNRYYWGCILPIISDKTGYTCEELHEMLKQFFLSKEAKLGNKTAMISPSTTYLSTIDMEEYLTRIREWSSMELSIYIPLPNEATYD